jgi:mannose-6-phosphate isomerase-like protein (cupin superfamily)
MSEPSNQASTADLTRYAIHYEPLFQALQTMDVQQLIDTVDDPWYNQTLIQVGDVLVRLGVMQGEYHWHKHDEQDEFFLVLDGELLIDLQGADTLRLGRHQACTVPKGVVHRTRAPRLTTILMVEAAGVMPVGD